MISFPKRLLNLLLNFIFVMCLGLSFFVTACSYSTSASPNDSVQAAASVELGDLDQDDSEVMDSIDIL